jgi:hypothetical protein
MTYYFKNYALPFAAALSLLFLLAPTACTSYNKEYNRQAENPEFIHRGIRRITDIMRHDIFSPPVASRIYAYSSVAAYEALIPGYPEYKSLAGQLNGLRPGPKPEAGMEYCFPLASAAALMKVGKFLVFSESGMDDLEEDIFQEFEKINMPPDVYQRSIQYGESVAAHVIQWSKKDNYAETRSAPKYTLDLKDPSRWTPTPPQYENALEPHWREIRPWVMDSARQFKPAPPIPFSTEKNSAFYKAAYEVYNTAKNGTPDQLETGLYWDCNPFQVTVSGHLMVSTKKISPGGHWMNIASSACRTADADIMKSAESYVLVALAMADAFISCWAEKYTSNLVRPETYINRYIDPEWRPNIETPPFPEHTSGHATISAACATVLTKIFGEPFQFTDSTEVEFGMAPRTFNTFFEASDQSAQSRLFAGIHYRLGNEAGRASGREIGAFVAENIKTK